MNRGTRLSAMLLLAIACAGPGRAVAQGQEPVKAPAGATREQKIRRLYDAMGYAARIQEDLYARALELTNGDSEKAKAAMPRAQAKPVEDHVLAELGRRLDDRALDAILPVVESAEGKRVLAALRANRELMLLDLRMTADDWDSKFDWPVRPYHMALDRGLETSGVVDPAASEKTAIGGLRNLASVQRQIQESGKIDVDRDRKGEFGTFLELTAAVGLRKGVRPSLKGLPPGSDFSARDPALKPPLMSPVYSHVDESGIVVKSGYCFRVYLPDQEQGFVHETGPAASVGLGGSKWGIGIQQSEAKWCAYAWPSTRGATGTRVFFVSEAGVVLESSNEVAKWSGKKKAPPGGSAFMLELEWTDVAVDVKGADGDIWKIVQ